MVAAPVCSHGPGSCARHVLLQAEPSEQARGDGPESGSGCLWTEPEYLSPFDIKPNKYYWYMIIQIHYPGIENVEHLGLIKGKNLSQIWWNNYL